MSSQERTLYVPAKEARAEIKVLNSVFFASLAPAFTVDGAKDYVARVKQEFADANHNVPVYLIGHGASTTAHSHDDGEPSGTAGRPALAVLQGSGLGDVVVVVTRYFGGTKLGTGGLVRAYGDAVREVLSITPLAVKLSTHTVRVQAPYTYFERIRQHIPACRGRILTQEFGTQVTLTARLPVDQLEILKQLLQETSNGAVQAHVLSTNPATIVTLDELRGEGNN